MKSRGSKVSVTRGGTRGTSRESKTGDSLPLQREKTGDSAKFDWPDPLKVIARDKEIKMKKDKIQVITCCSC